MQFEAELVARQTKPPLRLDSQDVEKADRRLPRDTATLTLQQNLFC